MNYVILCTKILLREQVLDFLNMNILTANYGRGQIPNLLCYSNHLKLTWKGK